jgi:hypothetical protein
MRIKGFPPDIRKRLKAAINKHITEIARRRDAIRDLIAELEAVADSCDEGLEDIERGLDSISKYL